MEGRHQNYQYMQCGLSNVVLLDVLVFNCKCGEIAADIPAISTLHRIIVCALLLKPTLLDKDEIRFLRKFTGRSATEFAEIIGHSKVTVSRWETGAIRITKSTDRVLRLAFFGAIVERDVKAALGPDSQFQLVPLVELAKWVKSFNLMEFLKTIKDEYERRVIRIDPAAVASYGLLVPGGDSNPSVQ